MSLDIVRIINYKSLKNVELKLTNDIDAYCFFGKNGAGKSNIIDAIKYFFDLIESDANRKNVIDTQNPYVTKMEIKITFNFKRLFSIGSNEYIDKYKDCINEYKNNNFQLQLSLTQFKSGEVKWFPDDKKLRRIIKNVFPVYLFDMRFMDIVNWDSIWDIMSDLSKTNLKIDRKEFESSYDELLEKAYGEKALKSLSTVMRKLQIEGIHINEFDYINRFKSLLASRLGGSEFLHKGNKLSYYSDGLNSFRYIKMLLHLIPELSSYGWKYPIVLVDEIEIGLHPQFIRQLVKSMHLFDGIYSGLFITTHSPVLLSGLIRTGVNTSIYRVNTEKYYTNLDKISQIVDDTIKSLVTMNEASYYFSDMILIVEGITEMQLLSHKKIWDIYPKLQRIDISSYNSNNSLLKIILPNISKFKIPYLLMVDMDKIISCKKSNDKIKFKYKSDRLVNPLSSEKYMKQEKFMFFKNKNNENKKLATYNTRQYIDKLIANSEFEYEKERYYMKEDKLLRKFRWFLTGFCSNYSVWPVSTTIEGIVINQQSYEIILEWLVRYHSFDLKLFEDLFDRDKQWSEEKDIKYRTTITRLAFDGKFESAQTIDQFKDFYEFEIEENLAELKRKIDNHIGLKAGGWIVSFINYYFNEVLKDVESLRKKRYEFSKVFSELDRILQHIENMLV